ncbi:MAG TPA: endonuclease domain-containing protein [Candidatus Angelobacter sp.]|nr:endonuclease domain-containing protein [Candidatus Angelobacter sp.]
MIAAAMHETYRGQPWSKNCREWVYFDCFLDIDSIRRQFNLPACVIDHVHRGTHDGRERGLVCSECNDAIMGVYEAEESVALFKG